MKRMNRRRHRFTVALAAALIGLMALGVVAYAAPMLTRFFSGQVQSMQEQIDEFNATPDEVKLAREQQSIEAHERRHYLDASAKIGGVTVALKEVRTNREPDAQDDEARTDGAVGIWLQYDMIPPFDPNWVDFKLSIGGEERPLERSFEMVLDAYRGLGERVTTQQGWQNPDPFSDSQLDSDGLLSTYLQFAVDDWSFTSATQMVLSAVIDGETLSIPFVFDPKKAREQAALDAETWISSDQWMLEERERLERIEAGAAPIGASARKGNVTLTASELSRIGDQLYLSYELRDPGRAAVRLKNWDHGNDLLRVDGLEAQGISIFGESATGEDLLNYARQYALPMDPARLPEESWIHLRTYKGNKPDIELVFRFNWRTNTAALPADTAENEQWLAQERALWESTLPRSDEPRSVFYSLKDLQPMDTPDGRIRLLYIQVNYKNHVKRSHPLYGPVTRIYYELDHSTSPLSDAFTGSGSPVFEIGGKRPGGIGAYTPEGINPDPKRPTIFQVGFHSAFDPFAGDGKIPVTLILPYGDGLEPQTFRCEFEIDPEKLIEKTLDDVSIFFEG